MQDSLTLYYIDPLEAICHLFGHPQFFGHMDFVPSKLFSDADHSNRVFAELSEGEFWWNVQVSLLSSCP